MHAPREGVAVSGADRPSRRGNQAQGPTVESREPKGSGPPWWRGRAEYEPTEAHAKEGFSPLLPPSLSVLGHLVDAVRGAPGAVEVPGRGDVVASGDWSRLARVAWQYLRRSGDGAPCWFESGFPSEEAPRAPWAVLGDASAVWPAVSKDRGFTGWWRFCRRGGDSAPGGPLPVAAGCFAYEAGRWGGDVAVAEADVLGLPDAVWWWYQTIVCGDRAEPGAPAVCLSLIPGRARAVSEAIRSALGRQASDAPSPVELLRGPWPDRDEDEYRRGVLRVLGAIRRGEIYQANVALRWDAVVRAGSGDDAGRAFARACAAVPVPFAALVPMGDAWVLSVSPECLVVWTEAGRVASLPIKGTRARATRCAVDVRRARSLLADAKERAEHVMIVDLVRNDVGRVASAGTVRVPVFERAVSFPNVWHLVSRVEGCLAAGRTPADLLAAILPGGSVTGAPKVRATQIVAQVEGVRRGAYCGAIGLVTNDGGGCLNLPIRTAVLWPASGRVCWHAGGGIVADSDPDRELDEARLKAAFWMHVFEGES